MGPRRMVFGLLTVDKRRYKINYECYQPWFPWSCFYRTRYLLTADHCTNLLSQFLELSDCQMPDFQANTLLCQRLFLTDSDPCTKSQILLSWGVTVNMCCVCTVLLFSSYYSCVLKFLLQYKSMPTKAMTNFSLLPFNKPNGSRIQHSAVTLSRVLSAITQ